jgi:hypothetical protein
MKKRQPEGKLEVADETPKETWLCGVFAMVGAGREIFADEHPDEYVRRLRAGWE